MIWKVLGIDKTKDKEKIRRAYLERLHFVNPEDDEEGFKELRSAYEEAVAYADEPEKSSEDDGETSVSRQKKNDVDRWVDRIDAIYSDMATRRDEECWKRVLNDPICDDLDTEIEAGEKLLVFIMSHSYMPQKIWQLIDNRFHYTEGISSLKEKFPENYLDYVVWQVKNLGFIDYELFDGNTADHPDEFINKLYEIKGAEENLDIEKADKLIKEIERYDITHPFVEVEKANCLLIKAGELDEFTSEKTENDIDDEDKTELRKQALRIMEDVDFEFSSNIYVHRIYGETLIANRKADEAMKVFDELHEKEIYFGSNSAAMLGRAKCMVLQGDYEQAKEEIEDILEDKVQDMDALALLDVVNLTLVRDYTKKLEDHKNLDIIIKLGWCYYQQREFKKGVRLLDEYGESEEYDFVNLRCRLYLADEDYEKAYPWAMKWIKLIDETENDGTREMEKRKKRHSLALFSIGVCLWEMELAKDIRDNEKNTISDGDAFRNKEKQERLDEAESYINQSIEEEENRLVMLSYMEQLAKFYLADKQYEKCVDECTEIIRLDSGFFPAYVHRQRANYELKNAREVVDDYFECIEIYPEYAPPYILAAEVFFAFEQYDDIENIILKAREAHIESDALELYEIRVLHYKEFSHENLQKALEKLEALENKIEKRTLELKHNEGNNDIKHKDNADNDEDRAGSEDKDIRATDIEKDEDIVREHVLICWDLDENERAISMIDEYVNAHPDCFSLQNLKIDILNQMGNSMEALKLCKKLYKDNPTVYMQTRLGICYERADDYKNARKTYEEAYRRDPKYNVVVRRLMYLFSYLSDKERNLDLCRQGIRYATEYIELTGSAEGYVERGNLYIDLYKLEDAVEDCRKAIELNSEAYYAYNNLGCALLKLRRTEEAIPPLLHAIELDESRDHLPYLNLAEAYTVLGRYDEAVGEYKRMLEVFPKHTYVWKDIVKLYLRMEEYDKAIAYYEKEIEKKKRELDKIGIVDRLKDPTSGTQIEIKLMDLYYDLGDAYRQAGKNVQANECYEKVEKRFNSFTKPRLTAKTAFKLMELFRDSGQLDKAKKLIVKMINDTRISSYEDSKQYLFIAATVYFELGDIQKAKKAGSNYLTKLKEYFGGTIDMILSDARYRPSYLYDIVIAYICMGELSEAKKYVEQIRECHLCVMCEASDCFEYHFAKGLIAETEGRYSEAKMLYERALELRGDYPCAARHLETVNEKL